MSRSAILLAVAIVACATGWTDAAKCSDHLLSLKADSWSEEDGGKYGKRFWFKLFMYSF